MGKLKLATGERTTHIPIIINNSEGCAPTGCRAHAKQNDADAATFNKTQTTKSITIVGAAIGGDCARRRDVVGLISR